MLRTRKLVNAQQHVPNKIIYDKNCERIQTLLGEKGKDERERERERARERERERERKITQRRMKNIIQVNQRV